MRRLVLFGKSKNILIFIACIVLLKIANYFLEKLFALTRLKFLNWIHPFMSHK